MAWCNAKSLALASFPRNYVKWPHRPAVISITNSSFIHNSTFLQPKQRPTFHTMPPLRPFLTPSRFISVRATHLPTRSLTTSIPRLQQSRQHQSPPPSSPSEEPSEPHYNFYRTHGRAFFKALTLAFLTMQLAHWSWLVLETEEERDTRNAQIRALEGEVRLLDEGRRTHRLDRAGGGEEEGDVEEGKA